MIILSPSTFKSQPIVWSSDESMKKESACETKTENVYFSTPKPFSSLLSSAPKFSSIRPPKPNKKRSQSVDGPRIPIVNAHPSVTDDTVTEVTNSQQSNETSKSMKMTNSCSLMPEETFAKVVFKAIIKTLKMLR